MEDFLDFFKQKKNLINLLLLGILVLALPLGVKLIREQQIIKSRAVGEPIVFVGDNVEQKDGKWIAKDSKISLELTSPLGGPPGSPVPTPASTATPGPVGTPTPAPGVQTVTIPVSGNLDDATEEQSNGNTFAGVYTVLEIGAKGGTPRNVGLRFTNVPSLAGATIVSADLILYSLDNDSGSFTGTWYGQDAAAPSSFSSCSGCKDVSSRPRTTATAGGNDTNFGTWVTGTSYTLTGFGPIIQELVTKYSNPSSIALMHIYSGGSGARVTPRYIYQSTNAAKLKITYTSDKLAKL